MDAIVLLRTQHREVEKLFKAVDKGDLSVVPEICAALEEHALIEEDVFYPAVRAEVPDEASDILESLEEHLIVKRLVAELREMDPDDEAWSFKQAASSRTPEQLFEVLAESITVSDRVVAEALAGPRGSRRWLRATTTASACRCAGSCAT